MLGENGLSATPSGMRNHTKNVPSQRTSGTRVPRSASNTRSRRRSYWARRSSTESCGPVSAAIPASCTGRKIPERTWSFSRFTRVTISALPSTNPSRQPAIP